MPHPTSNTGHGLSDVPPPSESHILRAILRSTRKCWPNAFFALTHSFVSVEYLSRSLHPGLFRHRADLLRLCRRRPLRSYRPAPPAANRPLRPLIGNVVPLLRTPSGAGRAPVRFRSDHRNGPTPHPSAGMFSSTGPAPAPSAATYRPQKASDWPFGHTIIRGISSHPRHACEVSCEIRCKTLRRPRRRKAPE